MEGILIIIGLIIGWNVLVGLFSGGSSSGGSSGGYTPTEKFRMKISNDTVEGDDFTWDVFDIKIRGPITGPYANFKAKFIVQAFDTTDGSEELIFSTYEDFQEKNSEVFWYESDSMPFPYEHTIIQDWIQVVKIPKIFLTFPRKGYRKLKFKVYVVNATTDKIIVEDHTTVSYTNPDSGYTDSVEHREYLEEMMVKTAMLISASDGDMDDTEANIVKDWVKRRISRYNEDYQTEHKNRLNGYIKEAYTEIQNGSIDIYDVLDGIDNISSEGEKFELFQLCLDVARADGEADKKELEMIYDIADHMGLNKNQVKSMIEKTLPITIHTGPLTPEEIIGINPSNMTKSEIKKHLMLENKKWSQRVTNTDPEIRKQANEMKNMIAGLRKKYA